MRARRTLGAALAAAAIVVGVLAPPAAADPTYCTGAAVSVDGRQMVVEVNGYYADPDGYDVILRCYVIQGGRERVGLTDPLVGPVAAAAATGVIDAAPFEICYELTISDMFNAWGYYESFGNC
ncbi:MAG TPA: hypothetical protein VEU29_03470 [Actinomycetota bacterium]|nr:hypothetical protein [Actinomycetota bacterium]